jgi:hypothetical protein
MSHLVVDGERGGGAAVRKGRDHLPDVLASGAVVLNYRVQTLRLGHHMII